ncbi:unnamed protein product [Lymnaea stagnalis]|uniref:ShKT domain-containing protein n=1 Tax=Lymnaea stagnalis TaxID=6523 RepID=A0AAV2IHJ7_LYMST
MDILALFGLTSMMVMTSLAFKSNWNQETRDYIVEIHNEKRREEIGCNMNKLVYDMELERQARQWAKRCVFKHETKKGRGENLAWDYNEKPEKELIKGSSQRWFDEKKKYRYGQEACGTTGACHYTQMVWWSTQKVGCYSLRCPNLVGAYRNSWYLVCFYTPKGNWIREKPYEKGCAKKCKEGQTEDNGLCMGEAKKGLCKDQKDNCPEWAEEGHCEKNPEYMLKECQKSCQDSTGCMHTCEGGETEVNGRCVGGVKGQTVSGGAGKVNGGSTSGGDDNGDCDDKDANCPKWAKGGQCKDNPGWMLVNCKKSCKVSTGCTTKCKEGETEVNGRCVGRVKGQTVSCFLAVSPSVRMFARTLTLTARFGLIAGNAIKFLIT